MNLQQKIAVSLSLGLLLMLGVFGYLSFQAAQQSRDLVVAERARLDQMLSTRVDDVARYAQVEDIVLALPQTLERMMVVMGALSLLVVAVAAWMAMWGLVRPINQLIAEAERIAGGELTTPIHSRRGDELGQLARALDSMRVRLKALLEDTQRWNRELGKQVEERTSQLSALVQASQALASTLDTNTIFQTILAQAKRICGPADAGVLLLYDRERRRLVIKASYGFEAEAISSMELRSGEGIAGQVFRSGEPILCNSFAEILGIRRGMSRQNRAFFDLATIGWSRVQKAVGVPLISEGQVIGSFVLYNLQSPGAFSESDAAVLRALADQAAAAIKNSQLFEEASKVGTLRELDRLKSEFVARASHELRTPLASIKSLAETLLREDLLLEPSEQRDYLTSIDNASDRLARIIENLLSVSRIESGGIKIRSEPVSLTEIVTRVVEQFRTGSSGPSYIVDLPPDLPWAMADADRVEDVLSNLISNATKYSPDSAAISIGASLVSGRSSSPEVSVGNGSGPHLEVWVADQGIGISNMEQGKLFQRFFRADNPATRKASGAGLGLYIVKAYIESMGGVIWVESRPGCGSTFKFTLPLMPAGTFSGTGIDGAALSSGTDDSDLSEARVRAPSKTVARSDASDRPSPSEAPALQTAELIVGTLNRAVTGPSDASAGSISPSEPAAPAARERGRHGTIASVLVVDDEVDVLRAAARNLRANGFEVVAATTGEDAIEILRGRKIDIAFVDIALPGIDGLELTRWVRANPATAELPLVFITAKAQEEDELRGWMAGCDGYVKKPFSRKIVLQMVEDLLATTIEDRRWRASAAIRQIEEQMRLAGRRKS